MEVSDLKLGLKIIEDPATDEAKRREVTRAIGANFRCRRRTKEQILADEAALAEVDSQPIKVTPELKAAISAQGGFATLEQIAVAFGCSVRTIRRICDDLEMGFKRRGWLRYYKVAEVDLATKPIMGKRGVGRPRLGFDKRPRKNKAR
jgi:hypothetical protein